MKINHFRGDLTDISAKKEALTIAFGLPQQLKPEADHFHRVHSEQPRMGDVANAGQNHTYNAPNKRAQLRVRHICIHT